MTRFESRFVKTDLTEEHEHALVFLQKVYDAVHRVQCDNCCFKQQASVQRPLPLFCPNIDLQLVVGKHTFLSVLTTARTPKLQHLWTWKKIHNKRKHSHVTHSLLLEVLTLIAQLFEFEQLLSDWHDCFAEFICSVICSCAPLFLTNQRGRKLPSLLRKNVNTG